MNYKKIINLGIGLITIILITIGIFQIWTNGKIKLDLFIAPSDAQVFINNKKQTIKSLIYLKPNQQYQIRIERADFEKIEITKTITKDDHQLFLGMSPINQRGETIVQKNLKQFLEFEKKFDNFSQDHIQILTKKHPILNKLPYLNQDLIIDYSFDKNSTDPDAKLIINVYADQLHRNQALLLLHENKLDFTKYKINFFTIDNRQPTDPFKEYIGVEND